MEGDLRLLVVVVVTVHDQAPLGFPAGPDYLSAGQVHFLPEAAQFLGRLGADAAAGPEFQEPGVDRYRARLPGQNAD